jgi:hypothetical protein
MSVTTESNKSPYTGTGAQTVFPYTFKIFKDTDLKVYVGGVLKTLTTDYTVDGVGNDLGGNVTFVSAPANGASVVLVRVLLKTQETVYPSNAKFPAKVHEAALDRAIMLIQQLAEVDSRCLKLAITTALTEPTMTDPTQAGHFLRVASLSPLAFEFASVTGQGAIGLPLSLADGGLGASFASRDAAVAGLNVGQWKQGADIASAATITLPNPLDGNLIKITGSTGISTLSTTGVTAGTRLTLWFTGTPLLTHGANFFLQGQANYQVVANDLIEFVYLGSSKWQETRRINAAAATGKFLKDDGTFSVLPSQGLAQDFHGLHAKTGPDNDTRKTTVALLNLKSVVMSDGTRYDDVTREGTDAPLTAAITASGAGGLDTGAEAASTWYSYRLIGKSSTKAKTDLKLVLHREKDFFLDESFQTNNANGNVRDAAARTKVAQGIKVDTTGKFVMFVCYLTRVGSPTGNVWLEVQGDNAGNPNGVVLATSEKKDVNHISSNSVQKQWFLFRVPATITATTQYHVVMRGDFAIDGVNFVRWWGENANNYANGVAKQADGSDVWSALSGVLDLSLEVYIVRNDAAVTYPATYDHECLLGYVYNDSGSDFEPFEQIGRYVKPLLSKSRTDGSGTFLRPDLLDFSAWFPPVLVTAHFNVKDTTAANSIKIAQVPEGGAEQSTGTAGYAFGVGYVTTQGAEGSAHHHPVLCSHQRLYMSGGGATTSAHLMGWEFF